MPDPTLQGTALRYAADDLSPDEREAFECRLAEDQAAREAVAEVVRLSAAAIGRPAPAPHPSLRAALRARLALSGRSRPLAWVALGGAVVAACALFAVALADRTAPDAARAEPAPPDAVEMAPAPRAVEPAPPGEPVAAEHPAPGACGDDRSVAEIWAEMSNHDGVEKARDDELRWRQRVRDLSTPHVAATAKGAATADGPHP